MGLGVNDEAPERKAVISKYAEMAKQVSNVMYTQLMADIQYVDCHRFHHPGWGRDDVFDRRESKTVGLKLIVARRGSYRHRN